MVLLCASVISIRRGSIRVMHQLHTRISTQTRSQPHKMHLCINYQVDWCTEEFSTLFPICRGQLPSKHYSPGPSIVDSFPRIIHGLWSSLVSIPPRGLRFWPRKFFVDAGSEVIQFLLDQRRLAPRFWNSSLAANWEFLLEEPIAQLILEDSISPSKSSSLP